MKEPFRVKRSDLSHDTAEAHAQIHRQASDGKAIGSAAVVMYDGGFFVTHLTGECERSPIWSIGALDMLRARLRRLAEVGGD